MPNTVPAHAVARGTSYARGPALMRTEEWRSYSPSAAQPSRSIRSLQRADRCLADCADQRLWWDPYRTVASECVPALATLARALARPPGSVNHPLPPHASGSGTAYAVPAWRSARHASVVNRKILEPTPAASLLLADWTAIGRPSALTTGFEALCPGYCRRTRISRRRPCR